MPRVGEGNQVRCNKAGGNNGIMFTGRLFCSIQEPVRLKITSLLGAFLPIQWSLPGLYKNNIFNFPLETGGEWHEEEWSSKWKIFINHFSLAGSTIINDARSRDLGTGPLDADLGQYKVYIAHLKHCGVRLVKQEWCQGSLVRHCNVKSYSKTDQHHWHCVWILLCISWKYKYVSLSCYTVDVEKMPCHILPYRKLIVV